MDVSINQLLTLPDLLHVTHLEFDDTGLTVVAHSIQNNVCCPVCQTPATRLHSHYQRTVNDLACLEHSIRLRLTVRKFFCQVHSCPRRIFVERLGPFIAPWARVTARLYQRLQILGLATGGMLGQRVARHFAIPTSWMTILRRIMALPCLPTAALPHVGIDDFSLRRGRSFGTLLVDLQTHQVVDVLPERRAETAQKWFETHPEIELISRDRGGDYAAAARRGAPQAIQVADRFHLYQNLIQVTERILAQCRASLHHYSVSLPPSGQPPETGVIVQTLEFQGLANWRPARDRWAEKRFLDRQTQRQDHYQQVCDFAAQGLKSPAIAAHTGLSRRTVCRWLQQGAPPKVARYRSGNSFDAYAAYVLRRWEAGEQNGHVLWQEIRQQGYTGSRSMVYRFLVPLRHSERRLSLDHTTYASPLTVAPLADFAPKKAVWLLARDPMRLDDEDQATLSTLCLVNETIQRLYELVQAFRDLLHQRAGEAALDQWLAQAKQSQIELLQGFVRGVERDKAAVIAGLTLPQSNGLVEGHVNKVKLIKRMMFGRASFALLRQRVLHAL